MYSCFIYLLIIVASTNCFSVLHLNVLRIMLSANKTHMITPSSWFSCVVLLPGLFKRLMA